MPVPFHPYADIFPLIEGEEFAGLVADIKANGLREKIVTLDGAILDGRNRYLAALAGELIADDEIPPDRPLLFQRFVPAIDGDPLKFVFSKNIHRRHLTIGQRAYAMAEFERFRHGGARKPPADQDANLQLETPASPTETRAELAEQGHVSERSIASAAVVRDSGVDDLKTAVKQGAIAVSAAEQIARLPEAQQPAELAKHLPNGARAIMGSRQEPDDSLDFFPTPPWATRALLTHVWARLGNPAFTTAWEPACGQGHISEVLREYFGDERVVMTDVFDYGYDAATQLDFLGSEASPEFLGEPFHDWIITNPPFNEKSESFVLRAIELAQVGVAMFVRMQWLETIGRYERIFRDKPPTLIAFFAERVNLCKGRWDPDGGTATAYIWLVWMKDVAPQAPYWIPPGCEKFLSRPEDRAKFAAWSLPAHDPATGEITEDAETDTSAVGEE